MTVWRNWNRPDPTPRFKKRVNAWRDIDSERRKIGLTIWATGAEVNLGRRLYRVRWTP